MQFTGILNNDIDKIWSVVSKLIYRAIQVDNEFTLEEVHGSLISKERQLWVSGNQKIEAVLITKLQDNICYVEICAGKGIESIQFLPIVENWAKKHGCKKINVLGRKGWERALKKDGYKFKSVTLSKEL